MQISLTKATNADIEELIEIEKTAAGLKIYSPMLIEDEWLVVLDIGVVYLVEAKGATVGSICYEKKGESHVRISGLVVEPHFQGQGIGRAAIEKVLEELKDTKHIDLDVHPENTKALKLYESLGFVAKSRKENFYGDGEPRLILVLSK